MNRNSANVQDSEDNIKEISVAIGCADHSRRIILMATVSSGKPYARSICSIFPLCMTSHAREKSMNKIVDKIFFIYSFNDSGNSQNLRSCVLIPLKTILIFLKNFLNIRSNVIEKQGIKNLVSHLFQFYGSDITKNRTST